jgi:hypothetical protein
MPILFNWEDASHQNFVVSLASLYAEIWKLERHNDLEKIKKVKIGGDPN